MSDAEERDNHGSLEAQEVDMLSPGKKNNSPMSTRPWFARWWYPPITSQSTFMMRTLVNRPDVRLRAIDFLFGMDDPLARKWSGIHIVCSRLEAKFEALLRVEFGVIWKILKREHGTPAKGYEVWHWCLAVLQEFQKLQSGTDGGGSGSMDNIFQNLIKGNLAQFTTAEKDHALLAIFAVVCWSTMALDPDLDLPARAGQTERSPSSTVGHDRHLSFHAKGMSLRDESSKMPLSQTARRPIAMVFRVLRGGLEGSGHSGSTVGDTEIGTIHESSVNFFSLYTISRVRIKWVEDLASHLVFDRQYRTLSVFCLPSFCVGTILQAQKISVLQQVTSEVLPSKSPMHTLGRDPSSVHREVLLSYRLLFGQSPGSRKLALKLLKQLKESSGAIDPFLVTICSTPLAKSRFLRPLSGSPLPNDIFPTSSLDLDNCLVESDTYSSQDDFPCFGQRLLAVQHYNLRQQPRRIRDLWRDRRNPLQWYTFWAVLWVGGITIVLGVLQLAAAVVQAYYSAWPSEQVRLTTRQFA
ncbi:hypothetical protein QBC39DRAFT_363154 [Podospora conica]|nr:hypothetical protein QBC39DRAFT_363154 [Schizothecium conicum]